MKAIADELVAALTPAIPEFFYLTNPRPTDQLTYPYGVFNYSYSRSTATDGPGVYDVLLEVDIFDRGENALRLLELEERAVKALERYRALRSSALAVGTLEQALDVPTLADGLYRRLLQFTIRLTMRK